MAGAAADAAGSLSSSIAQFEQFKQRRPDLRDIVQQAHAQRAPAYHAQRLPTASVAYVTAAAAAATAVSSDDHASASLSCAVPVGPWAGALSELAAAAAATSSAPNFSAAHDPAPVPLSSSVWPVTAAAAAGGLQGHESGAADDIDEEMLALQKQIDAEKEQETAKLKAAAKAAEMAQMQKTLEQIQQSNAAAAAAHVEPTSGHGHEHESQMQPISSGAPPSASSLQPRSLGAQLQSLVKSRTKGEGKVPKTEASITRIFALYLSPGDFQQRNLSMSSNKQPETVQNLTALFGAPRACAPLPGTKQKPYHRPLDLSGSVATNAVHARTDS